MNFNFENLYKKFDEVKSAKEYTDYIKDINDNLQIINSFPFDAIRARHQLSNLTTKYEDELNSLASANGNGMTVVRSASYKNDAQLKYELDYINHQIPIIALKRELDSYTFKKLLGIE